jgi:hypothetical protein
MRNGPGRLYDKWSISVVICDNGHPSHGGDRKLFEVMTSTLTKGILGSVVSLLVATHF